MHAEEPWSLDLDIELAIQLDHRTHGPLQQLQLPYFTADLEGTILHAHSSLIGRLQRYKRSSD